MNDDTQREARERELAAAWRDAVARDARETPPPTLDAAIVAAARAAVRPRRPRYLVPVALAASLVVAVGLGLRQQREIAPVVTPDVSSAPVAAEAAPSAEPAGDVDAAVGAAAGASVSDEPAPAAVRQRERVEAKADAAVEQEVRETRRDKVQNYEVEPAPTAARNAMAPRAAPAARADFASGTAATDPVVAEIRTLLAAGDRQAAATLARDFVARTPPGVLPADLEFLLSRDGH